jgi:hypothetical protein
MILKDFRETASVTQRLVSLLFSTDHEGQTSGKDSRKDRLKHHDEPKPCPRPEGLAGVSV